MVRRKSVEVLVSILVAVALLIFVFLSGLGFGFGFFSYLFLIVVASIVYIFFLIVFFKSQRRRFRTEFQVEPIVEYKSPVMEKFDKEYKESKAEEENVSDSEEFVGTEESKMYHKINCRFAKLIKPKYRIEGSKELFKKKKYKACSVCKPNKS